MLVFNESSQGDVTPRIRSDQLVILPNRDDTDVELAGLAGKCCQASVRGTPFNALCIACLTCMASFRANHSRRAWWTALPARRSFGIGGFAIKASPVCASMLLRRSSSRLHDAYKDALIPVNRGFVVSICGVFSRVFSSPGFRWRSPEVTDQHSRPVHLGNDEFS